MIYHVRTNFIFCREATISGPGIIYGTIWGSFPVLGSFAAQSGDHLRSRDHLRTGIICGPAEHCRSAFSLTEFALVLSFV